jgi:hypothetical protein
MTNVLYVKYGKGITSDPRITSVILSVSDHNLYVPEIVWSLNCPNIICYKIISSIYFYSFVDTNFTFDKLLTDDGNFDEKKVDTP